MRDEVLSGIGCAVVGALLPMPYAAAAYERANALSCCENPRAGALLLGFVFVPIAVFLLTPVMIGSSRLCRRLSSIARGAALAVIGMFVGALVGRALFWLTLLPAEMGNDAFGSWGIAPGALVGAGAAIGWWIGTEVLGRKKVKNG